MKDLTKTDYINYISGLFEPGTIEYMNIIQLYSTLYVENQVQSYGDLAHGLIRHAALYEINEKEMRGRK